MEGSLRFEVVKLLIALNSRNKNYKQLWVVKSFAF